jgi:putative endonuclease
MHTPLSTLWRGIVRAASTRLLERQSAALAPDALLGRRGEEAAYWYLREQGFIMVGRNYRPEGLPGEIDLIAWEDKTLVFIEVKSRSSSMLRAPEAAVDREKERVMKAAAREYRRSMRCAEAPSRFDIISVEMASEGPILQHFRDVFR